MLRKFITFLFLLIAISTAAFSKEPTLALVLSGGGAKGIAHIAVIEELEKRSIVPDMVIGTSMGALIGCFYAAGYTSDEIEEIIADEGDVMSLFMHFNARSNIEDLRGGKLDIETNIANIGFSSDSFGTSSGVIDDQMISAFLRKNLSKVLDVDDFSNLSIPFYAVGTDYITGEAIVFSSGDLFTAIRASMSLPIIFNAVTLEDGRVVVDGGMVDNLPVDLAHEKGADIVLAVDIKNANKAVESIESDDVMSFSGSVLRFLDLISQSNTLESYENADYLITLDAVNENYDTLEFGKWREIIETGRAEVQKYEEMFSELEKELGDREYDDYISYSEIEDYTIENIVYPGLEDYKGYFDFFIGKKADKALMNEFERTLKEIRDREHFMNLSYSVKDAVIYVKSTDYKEAQYSLSLGASVNLVAAGDFRDGSFSLSLLPKFDILFDIFLSEHKGEILTGLDFDEATSLLFSYYYRFGKITSVFADFSAGVGSYSSISKKSLLKTTSDTTDFSLRLRGGVSFQTDFNFITELSVGFDYYYLEKLYSPSGMEERSFRNIFAPVFSAYIEYDALSDDLLSSGVEVIADASVNMAPPLSYSASLSLSSRIPSFIDNTAFLLEYSFYSIRGDKNLSSSFGLTQAFSLSRDDMCLALGIRGVVAEDVFVDGLIYAEGFEKAMTNAPHLWPDALPAPFVMMDDYDIGFIVKVGYNTDFGQIAFKMNFSVKGAYTVGVSFK